jgi:hypothetical protein
MAVTTGQRSTVVGVFSLRTAAKRKEQVRIEREGDVDVRGSGTDKK